MGQPVQGDYAARDCSKSIGQREINKIPVLDMSRQNTSIEADNN